MYKLAHFAHNPYCSQHYSIWAKMQVYHWQILNNEKLEESWQKLGSNLVKEKMEKIKQENRWFMKHVEVATQPENAA